MQHRLHQDQQTLPPDNVLVSSDDVRQEIDRILNSRYFSQAPMKRKFVQLVCDYYLQNRATELSEYLIGREVYERNERYSPAEDPVVRVAAHDVRKRLEQYYQNEGKEDPVRLEIPLGSYEPVFKRAPMVIVDPVTPPVEVSITSPPSGRLPQALPAGDGKWMFWIGVILVVIALVIVASPRFFSWNGLRAANSSEEKNLQRSVWGPFFASGDPTILVLSNPPVYTVANQADPEVISNRSIELPQKRADELLSLLGGKSPIVRGKLSIYLSPIAYTGIGEAIGVHHITNYFRSHGLGVTLKQSRNVSAEDLKDHNLVALGGTLSNDWSGKLPVSEDFYFTQSVTVANRRPQSGEQAEYKTRFDERTGQILEDYALVTVKPATKRNNMMMILGGLRDVGTGAAAEFVTSRASLDELTRRLQQQGGKGGIPRYCQALLKVAVESNMPTTITLVSLHVLSVPEE